MVDNQRDAPQCCQMVTGARAIEMMDGRRAALPDCGVGMHESV